MATEEGKEKKNPYEAGGLGTGGKFRKRPYRRHQTTPYDRPPNSLRSPTTRNSNNGWFSKLVVDPAQRLIAHSANSLFSSLFRKRLPPPPHPPSRPSSSETKQELRDNHKEESAFVANNSSGKQQGAVGESDVQINCSDGGGLSELEKLLRQKTFTRSEIDHLTALMRSRTVDVPTQEEEERTEVVASEPRVPCEPKEEYPNTAALENGVNRLAVAPYVASSVPIEDVASPAELAKAYMGSRPLKVSSRSPALRDDPTFLKSENFPINSSITSIVPRATRHPGVHENGFVTPRSRGRSAMYSMARTPYARVYPTSNLKGGRLAVEGEPSSSVQSALVHGMLSGSKQGAVKRNSLALDNDIGSVGPIRRVRHKSNLLYSKGSSLSIARSGVGIDSAQQPSSSIQKPTLPDEVTHSHTKLLEENVNDTKASMSFPSLPSKSSEMASKILQQLDKLVSPKEKSSESRLPNVNDISPMKLSPSMLRGQALRSMETVDSSKLLDNIQDNKLDGTLGNLSASAQKLTSQIEEVENGPLMLNAPSDGLVPVVTDADATNLRTQIMSSAKSVDSSTIKSVSYPPQKKRAFHMSAPEDSLDLDDDAYPNGAVSSFLAVEKETRSSIAIAEKTTSFTGAIVPENPPTLSILRQSKNFTKDGEAHVGTADGCRVGEKVDVSTSITSSIPDPTLNPVTVGVTAATKTSFGSDKRASPNRSIANPPLFNFGNQVVLSTATVASSDEITKSGPIFGLEKVPQMPSTSSSVGGESNFLKFGASSDSMPGSSVSSTTVAGATGSMPEVRESDKADTETNTDTGFSVRSSQPAVSSATSTSLLTSPTNIFTFGHSSTPNQNNGSIASSPSFSSSFSSLVSNNFTSQNIFSSSSLAASSSISATAASAGSNMTTSTPAIIASSNSSSSTPVVASSSSTTSIFKFGSTPASTIGLPVSSSGSEPLETKSSQVAGVGNLSSSAFGSSSAAVGSTGSGIFGFSSSSTKTLNSQSQGSVIGATVSSGSMLGAQVSPAAGGFAASTQTQSVSFGSSASSSSFGLTGSTASSGSSLFTSSSPATITAFSSGSSFGSSASSPSFGLTGSTASSGSSLFNSSSPATSTAFSSGSSFGSSASSPSFGLTGSTASSGSSLFTSSSPATNTAFSSGSSLFASSSPATNIFNSGSTFGLGTSASASIASSVTSSSGTSSSLFGPSSWHTGKSPFGSTFSSSSSSGFSFGASTASVASSSSPFGTSTASAASTGLPFGTSTASVASTSSPPMFLSTNSASTPQFSFTSAAATTSTQPAFGSPSPAFTFGPAPVNNSDQMSMEDSMAEDTVQATPPAPAAPIFGQQPAPAQSNFVFGASAPSGASPFQFGSQQNTAPQNPSPFQASGSLEFNAGGSFSLGAGGGDKSGRRFLRVKNKQRKK